jgi:hypothetical protein
VCGGLIDLGAVARRCRAVGAQLVLDTTQSTGALPIDVAAIDPDYLVAASYKWLFGPYSLGFLYAAPRHQQGRPLEQGWIARAGARNFRTLSAYDEALEPNARRFDMGERSNFALLPVAGAALEQLLAWGVADIAETLGTVTAGIAARLADKGVESLPPEARAPHYLSSVSPAACRRYRGAACRGAGPCQHSQRPHRITPHLYNNDADVERLVAELARAYATMLLRRRFSRRPRMGNKPMKTILLSCVGILALAAAEGEGRRAERRGSGRADGRPQDAAGQWEATSEIMSANAPGMPPGNATRHGWGEADGQPVHHARAGSEAKRQLPGGARQ